MKAAAAQPNVSWMEIALKSPRERASLVERWLGRVLLVGAMSGSLWWYGGYVGFESSSVEAVFVLCVGSAALGGLLLLRRDRERAFRARAERLEREQWRSNGRAAVDQESSPTS